MRSSGLGVSSYTSASTCVMCRMRSLLQARGGQQGHAASDVRAPAGACWRSCAQALPATKRALAMCTAGLSAAGCCVWHVGLTARAPRKVLAFDLQIPTRRSRDHSRDRLPPTHSESSRTGPALRRHLAQEQPRSAAPLERLALASSPATPGPSVFHASSNLENSSSASGGGAGAAREASLSLGMRSAFFSCGDTRLPCVRWVLLARQRAVCSAADAHSRDALTPKNGAKKIAMAN
jgi:hypothetical protein